MRLRVMTRKMASDVHRPHVREAFSRFHHNLIQPMKTFRHIVTIIVGLFGADRVLTAQSLEFLFTGQVTAVNAALTPTFSVGDTVLFSFRATFPTDEFTAAGATGVMARQLQVKIGSNYTLTSSTPFGEVYFRDSNTYSVDSFNFEKNNMLGASVNGHELSDTFVSFSFGEAYGATPLSVSEFLSLNGFSAATAQQSSLSFDQSPDYKYVSFSITSVSVSASAVPEPGATAVCLGFGAVLAAGALRRRRAAISRA